MRVFEEAGMAVALSDDSAKGIAWGLHEEESQGGDSVMALVNGDTCWLVENADGEPDYVSVRSASAEDCEKAFLAMVEPLERALEPAG